MFMRTPLTRQSRMNLAPQPVRLCKLEGLTQALMAEALGLRITLLLNQEAKRWAAPA